MLSFRHLMCFCHFLYFLLNSILILSVFILNSFVILLCAFVIFEIFCIKYNFYMINLNVKLFVVF